MKEQQTFCDGCGDSRATDNEKYGLALCFRCEDNHDALYDALAFEGTRGLDEREVAALKC